MRGIWNQGGKYAEDRSGSKRPISTNRLSKEVESAVAILKEEEALNVPKR